MLISKKKFKQLEERIAALELALKDGELIVTADWEKLEKLIGSSFQRVSYPIR